VIRYPGKLTHLKHRPDSGYCRAINRSTAA
jgi:hypothetical protein